MPHCAVMLHKHHPSASYFVMRYRTQRRTGTIEEAFRRAQHKSIQNGPQGKREIFQLILNSQPADWEAVELAGAVSEDEARLIKKAVLSALTAAGVRLLNVQMA
jgi:hypothetical protein